MDRKPERYKPLSTQIFGGAPEAADHFRKLLEHTRDIVSLADATGRIVFTTAVRRVPDRSEEAWAQANPFTVVHPDDLGQARRSLQESLERPGEAVESEVRMKTANDEWADIAVTSVNLLDDPDVGGLVVTARDVSEVRRAQRLASSQATVLELIACGATVHEVFDRCVELLEENGMGGRSSIYLLDGERLIMQAGRAPGDLNAWMAQAPRAVERSLCDAAIDRRAPAFIHDTATGPLEPALRQLVTRLGIRAAWSQPITALGSDTPIGTLSTIYDRPHMPTVHERRVADAVCSLVSIAVERISAQERLAHLALHDGLTGLPNRGLLLDRLEHALARNQRSGASMSVLFCDLDRFKVINDSLGHAAGDQLLRAVAERLVQVVGPSDTVARFGGDEFVVLLEDVLTTDAPHRVADRIMAALDAPFALGDHDVYLTTSIGMVTSSDHQGGSDWLRDADAAMYRAKAEGGNRVVLFDHALRDAAVTRLEVENDLRRAVDRDQLEVHYQPVIDLRSGRIVGAEALVRWQHPERGLVSPIDFIPVAEEIGAIDELGRHILDTAVRELSELRRHHPLENFQLGVNVSARQLSGLRLDEVVVDVCRRHGWPTEDLLLEITETALALDVEEPIDLLDRITAAGVQLAIDDFGTGHSSLSRLGRTPVTQVKIDRSFVSVIGEPGPDDDGAPPTGRLLERMVDAVVAVARALGVRTSAEGIETQAQLDYLRMADCDLAQGYFFAKPLPIDDFAALVASDPRW